MNGKRVLNTFKAQKIPIPVNYTFNVKNRNTSPRFEICSLLGTKTPKQRQWRRSGVFVANI